jgi:hypothetical protein
VGTLARWARAGRLYCARCAYLRAEEPINPFGLGCSLLVVAALLAVLFALLAPWVGLVVLGAFTALFLVELVIYLVVGHRVSCALTRAYAYSFGLVRFAAAALGVG